MKRCFAPDGFTGAGRDTECTSNITGFEAEGWYCDSTFACGKEWKSFKPPASTEEIPLKEAAYPEDEMEVLAKAYHGSVDDTFAVLDGLLDEDDCRSLRAFTDEQYFDLLESGAAVKNPDYKHDYRLNVPQGHLKRVLKASSLERVTGAFREYAGDGIAITRIALRRSINDGSNRIEFHTDYGNSEFDKLVSMIVFLNNEGEISGGDLHYVTRNGIIKTHPGRGSAVIHGHNIVHGVDSYEGKRYIMFFLGTPAMKQEMLAGISLRNETSWIEDEDVKGTVVPPVHTVASKDEL